ncbi:MAG: hypothetical protein ACC661_06175 [Verrucomicrobiales bacterium]
MNTLLEQQVGPPIIADTERTAGMVLDRLLALEELVRAYTRRIDTELATRVSELENRVNLQVVTTRKEISREANERQEQFATLAGKVVKNVDRLERTALRLEQSQSASASEVEARLEDQLSELREELLRRSEELRSFVHARLDA